MVVVQVRGHAPGPRPLFTSDHHLHYHQSFTELRSRPPHPACSHWVNCTTPTLAPSNYRTTFALALKSPGAARLTSGVTVALKVYDTLYRWALALLGSGNEFAYSWAA